MAQVTVATGYDVDYYLDQVGVDYYLTASGEPPGIWAGKGAEALGLRGPGRPRRGQQGDDAGPVPLRHRPGRHAAGQPPEGRRSTRCGRPTPQVEEAIRKRIAALGRFATPEEKRDIRLQERARMRARTPYYDVTFSAEKSVSLMFAGWLAAAKRAADEGREQDAERLRSRGEADRSGRHGRRG